MKLKDFYTVEDTGVTGDNNSTEIIINRSHPIYTGHFPERPVTPGVVLMQLFQEEAQRQTGYSLQLAQAGNVKFIAVVDPNEEERLILHTSIQESPNTITLKGTAEHKGAIALKINAVYSIKN